MARKVLISFLGTGPLESKETRTYKTVNYHLGGIDLGNYPFVSAALKKHYGCECVLLIGTVHSMWEEVYRWYRTDRQMPIDEDVYWNIATTCEQANYTSPLLIPHKEDIEASLGDKSQIILIKYGITEKEIKENINIILGLQQYLKDGDELIVDVTHSFRSLPIFMMNLLIYLQNVSSKHIMISHIHYGMLEIIRELGYAPILDIRTMMDVNDWITGAYNFLEFGNTYKMAKLLESDESGNYKEAAKALRKFADLKNLNYLREFRSGFKSIGKLAAGHDLPEIGEILIPNVIEKFTQRFPSSLRPSVYQYRMAEWHEKHHNYGYALINLVESALTFCCELVPFAERTDIRRALNYAKDDIGVPDVEDLRSLLHDKMAVENINFDEFYGQYGIVNRDRNMIAHDLDRKKSYDEIIRDLKNGLKYFYTYLGR